MSSRSSAAAPSTLALCTILHAFTHAYQALLLPLYLVMTHDLGLPGVNWVALIVALYGAVYFLASYPAGILADHFNRKALLGIGLIGNAIAIGLMGLTQQYWILLALAVLAGLFGTLYHPAANALAPAHYPRSPGLALGVLGIGSGIGFFAGPRYAGWRTETGSSFWAGVSNWQVPCIEAGLAGVAMGIIFLLLAREAGPAAGNGKRQRMPMGKGMRRRTLAIALVSGCRDFAGVASASLLSIYLLKAHRFDTGHTGWVLGVIGLVSIIATPVGIWLTRAGRRLPGLAIAMICGGITLATVPHWPVAWIIPVLTIFQVFHLGSYAISEVSLIERVSPETRGRVIGMYLTVAGTLGAVAPWVIGYWTDLLGSRAYEQSGYYMPFAVLGGMMVVASLAVRLIARLGRPQHETMDEAFAAAATEPAI